MKNLLKNLHKDLTRPPGRSNRTQFWAGFLFILASVYLQSHIMAIVGHSTGGFLLGFFWLIFNVFIIYSLYARRLHDLGLSIGLWFAMIFVTLIVIGFTVAAGGGADYFSAMSADPTIAEDAERNRVLIEKYQADLKENLYWARWVNLLPALALTLFCGLKPGQKMVNKYGNSPE